MTVHTLLRETKRYHDIPDYAFDVLETDPPGFFETGGLSGFGFMGDQHGGFAIAIRARYLGKDYYKHMSFFVGGHNIDVALEQARDRARQQGGGHDEK